MIKLNPNEKAKLRRSDIIVFGISKYDALAPLWQEKYFENYEYAMPYKACRSWYNTLFSNNPNLQYNKPEEERELGEVIIKEDKRGSNKPKFAFIVSRNISEDINTQDTSLNDSEKWQEARELDRNEKNRELYLDRGIKYIRENLLKECPITYRMLVPIEAIKDFPRTMWGRILRKLETLDEYFINTEVILFEGTEVRKNEKRKKNKQTTGKREGEQNKAEINNIKGKKSFPVIRVEGSINNINMKALADTGAAVSVINSEDAYKAKLEIRESKVKLRTANNPR